MTIIYAMQLNALNGISQLQDLFLLDYIAKFFCIFDRAEMTAEQVGMDGQLQSTNNLSFGVG